MAAPAEPRARKVRRYPGVERVPWTDHRTGERRLTTTYFIRYRWRGKQYREKTGETDPKRAYEILLQRKEEMRRGRLIGAKAERVHLPELERLVLDDYENRGLKTSAEVKRHYARLLEWFKGVRAMDITAADLNAYARARREGAHPFSKTAAIGTVALELANLQRGFTLATRSKLIPDAPRFPLIKLNNARKVFLDRPVFEVLRSHLPEHIRPVAEVGLITGWRKEAVLSREWRHVDFVGGWLTLDGEWSKNGRPVTVPLIPPLRAILEAQHELAREVERTIGRLIPWCFFYPRDIKRARAGGRIVDFWGRWRRAREAAGLPGLRFHDLRRGAVRTLRRAGASEHEIMEWVGIRTRSVFDRYDLVDDERKLETGRKLADFYERQGTQAPGTFKKKG